MMQTKKEIEKTKLKEIATAKLRRMRPAVINGMRNARGTISLVPVPKLHEAAQLSWVKSLEVLRMCPTSPCFG